MAVRSGRLPGRQLSGVMPYGHFAKLTPEDLKAIFAHITMSKRTSV